ncbi:hypothetical protein CR513_53477, partial [Mucuna pruriens]
MLGTEKPKVARGDRLDHQRTPADLILIVLAIRGEPSPSAMAIVVDGGATEAKPLSSTDPLCAFDPEIEKTLRRLRRTRNLIVNNSRGSDSVINSNQFCTDNSVASSNIFAELGQMENNDRTLKELATPDVVYPPWCIQYPPWCIQYPQLELAQTYELKSGLIHLLPKFHGLTGEYPQVYLKEFHVVCSTMRPQGISEDFIKMKAFPFSLNGAAKDWFIVQHLGRYEAHILEEVLFGIQNCVHQKGNLWDKAAYKRNSA